MSDATRRAARPGTSAAARRELVMKIARLAGDKGEWAADCDSPPCGVNPNRQRQDGAKMAPSPDPPKMRPNRLGLWLDLPRHHHAGADPDALVEIEHIGVVHADAAVGDEPADRTRHIGAVNRVLAAIERHGGLAHRVPRAAARDHLRQGGL